MSYCKSGKLKIGVSRCVSLPVFNWLALKPSEHKKGPRLSRLLRFRKVALAASWLLSQPISAMVSGIWSATPCLLELQRWVPPLRSSFCSCPMWERATARLWPSQALSPWLLATTTSASLTPGLLPLRWELRMATMSWSSPALLSMMPCATSTGSWRCHCSWSSWS